MQPPSYDADTVLYRLEEAGATLLALPHTGPSPKLRTQALELVRSANESYGWSERPVRPPIPDARRVTRMDEALGWIGLIPADRYVLRRIREYHMLPESSGRFAALYRPVHFSGLELGISVAWAALQHQPTGAPICFSADVVAVAKRDLHAGDVSDGEGGYCVWGKQVPASLSLREGLLPLGLAQNVRLNRDISAGDSVRWADVSISADDPVVRFRQEMEAAFGPDAAERITP